MLRRRNSLSTFNQGYNSLDGHYNLETPVMGKMIYFVHNSLSLASLFSIK